MMAPTQVNSRDPGATECSRKMDKSGRAPGEKQDSQTR